MDELLLIKSEIDGPAQLESSAVEPMYGASILALMVILLKRKRLITAITGIAALTGVVISLILPVRFTATTRLLTPQPTQSAVSLMMSQAINSSAASLLNATGGGLGLKNPNDLYIGLLQSRPVADAIVQQFGLAGIYHLKSIAKAREKLGSNTTIKSEKSGLLAVSVEDRDKERAARIANAYTNQLRALTNRLALTEASRRRLFYEGELKKATDDLVSAELAFQGIQQKKGLVQLDAQVKAVIEGMAELRAEVAAKEVQLKAQRSYSTENNPDVQMTVNQLSSLREQLALMEERNRSSSGIGLQDVAGSGMEYLRAQHELQYRQSVLDLLTKQYDAAKLDEAKDAAIIQVTETAIPPDEKSAPHRSQFILTWIVCGFFGACLYVAVAPIVRKELILFRVVIDSSKHT